MVVLGSGGDDGGGEMRMRISQAFVIGELSAIQSSCLANTVAKSFTPFTPFRT